MNFNVWPGWVQFKILSGVLVSPCRGRLLPSGLLKKLRVKRSQTLAPHFPDCLTLNRKCYIIFNLPAGYPCDNFTWISFHKSFAEIIAWKHYFSLPVLFVSSPFLPLSLLPTKSVFFVIFGVKNFPSINFKAPEKQSKQVELGRDIRSSYLNTYSCISMEPNW